MKEGKEGRMRQKMARKTNKSQVGLREAKEGWRRAKVDKKFKQQKVVLKKSFMWDQLNEVTDF